jgi:hypothetical protein
MSPFIRCLLLCAVLFNAGISAAQDAKMEVPQSVINRLLTRIGTLSDSGVAQPTMAVILPTLFEFCEPIGFIDCPFGPSGFDQVRIPMARCRKVGGGVAIVPSGDPLSWQWWVLDTKVTISSGAMTFTATVRYRVGDYWDEVTRTVPAQVTYVAAENGVYLQPASFDVPLLLADGSRSGANAVDVDRLFRIRLPIQPQAFTVALPNGSSRSLNGRVSSGSAQYSPGKLTMTFNVAF